MAWKMEVIADSSGKWVGNELRFAKRADAYGYGQDLMNRWTSVRQFRLVKVKEPATHVFTPEGAKAVSA